MRNIQSHRSFSGEIPTEVKAARGLRRPKSSLAPIVGGAWKIVEGETDNWPVVAHNDAAGHKETGEATADRRSILSGDMSVRVPCRAVPVQVPRRDRRRGIRRGRSPNNSRCRPRRRRRISVSARLAAPFFAVWAKRTESVSIPCAKAGPEARRRKRCRPFCSARDSS